MAVACVAAGEIEKCPRVAMAHSAKLIEAVGKHPKFKERASQVYSLIEAYSLHSQLMLVAPPLATEGGLKIFHSADYIDYIKSTQVLTENDDDYDDEEDSPILRYGLYYDCPIFDGLYEYVSSVSGATIAMTSLLMTDHCDVAINWHGGLHHGKKDEASGFCYINDVVIGILCLMKHYQKILYIDLDIHHGDGVQDAFYYSSKVFTVSFHKYAVGFFPGTGSVSEIGNGSGLYCNVNVPLWDGINDEQYLHIFKNVMSMVHDSFTPQAVVVQCGADCLAGDPLGSFNLSIRGMGACIEFVMKWGLPVLLLGGGGYNFSNTARYWAYLTSLVLKQEISTDIPEHDYLPLYKPDYQLDNELLVNTKSQASTEDIEELIKVLSKNILRQQQN